MSEVSTIGLDIAKSVFQVHGVDVDGAVVIRKRISRAKLLEFFATLPACLVGIEACGLILPHSANPPGSNCRERQVNTRGLTPRQESGLQELMPSERARRGWQYAGHVCVQPRWDTAWPLTLGLTFDLASRMRSPAMPNFSAGESASSALFSASWSSVMFDALVCAGAIPVASAERA